MNPWLRFSPTRVDLRRKATSHPDEGNELLVGVFITPGESRALEQAHMWRARGAIGGVLTSGVCR